jgi:hypothetical protein
VQATGGGQDNIVYSQQVATFSGAEDVIAQYGTLGSPDDFDSWSLERDRRDELAANSRTTEYVSPEVTGYQDLDHYGTWASEPGYGYVWAPTYVNVGWAPYRYGRWVSVAPWGWTWVDDAPWGYAPFHYGRWAHVRNRWCWVPGPRHARPVYAPAVVGWGPAHGGNVSWFPLGPRETYVPGYRFSRHYLERVNTSNTFVARELVNRVYDNRDSRPTFSNRVAGACDGDVQPGIHVRGPRGSGAYSAERSGPGDRSRELGGAAPRGRAAEPTGWAHAHERSCAADGGGESSGRGESGTAVRRRALCAPAGGEPGSRRRGAHARPQRASARSLLSQCLPRTTRAAWNVRSAPIARLR